MDLEYAFLENEFLVESVAFSHQPVSASCQTQRFLAVAALELEPVAVRAVEFELVQVVASVLVQVVTSVLVQVVEFELVTQVVAFVGVAV